MDTIMLFYRITLVSLLVLLFTNCATSLPTTEPSRVEMEKANTVILKVDRTTEEAYQRIAQILNDKGHTFSNTDEVLKIVSTDYKRNEGFQDYDYKISASIREIDDVTYLFLKGMVVKSDMWGGTTEKQAMNTTFKTSFEHLVWSRLKDIAGEFGYQELLYQRQ